MKSPRTLTILSRRFPAKRIFIAGAGSGLGRAMAHQLMDPSGHDPAEAARAILGAAAAGDLYIAWPRGYRLVWRLKRFFPLWFLKRVQRFRDAQIRRAARRPPG
jgi:hypothetical protein